METIQCASRARLLNPECQVVQVVFLLFEEWQAKRLGEPEKVSAEDVGTVP